MNRIEQAIVAFPLDTPVRHVSGWSGLVTNPPAVLPVAPHLAGLPDGGEPVEAGYDFHLAVVGPGTPIVHVTWWDGPQECRGWFNPRVLSPEVPAAVVRTRGKRGGVRHQ